MKRTKLRRVESLVSVPGSRLKTDDIYVTIDETTVYSTVRSNITCSIIGTANIDEEICPTGLSAKYLAGIIAGVVGFIGLALVIVAVILAKRRGGCKG